MQGGIQIKEEHVYDAWGTLILFTTYYSDEGVELPPEKETPARMFISFRDTLVWNTKEGKGVDTACLLYFSFFGTGGQYQSSHGLTKY